jgi:hypothetical protein
MIEMMLLLSKCCDRREAVRSGSHNLYSLKSNNLKLTVMTLPIAKTQSLEQRKPKLRS